MGKRGGEQRMHLQNAQNYLFLRDNVHVWADLTVSGQYECQKTYSWQELKQITFNQAAISQETIDKVSHIPHSAFVQCTFHVPVTFKSKVVSLKSCSLSACTFGDAVESLHVVDQSITNYKPKKLRDLTIHNSKDPLAFCIEWMENRVNDHHPFHCKHLEINDDVRFLDLSVFPNLETLSIRTNTPLPLRGDAPRLRKAVFNAPRVDFEANMPALEELEVHVSGGGGGGGGGVIPFEVPCSVKHLVIRWDT